ncbi:unnamed protein product [Adineta ricciae]|uniref:Uncharacterized protein n=1 Tax=Adineta ricciae TaxID=249248 RepID=A0A814ZXY6_ADIRI|nr:unnamed protein product [Adineta ricciae]CAF1486436.1 unnamed protein product [Adineta ricciae]
MKYIFYFLFIHSIIAVPQLNLYFTTNEVNENEFSDEMGIRYNCFRVASNFLVVSPNVEISSYCMSESSRKFHIEHDEPSFSFTNLAKKHITSEDLYIWSTPIDIIEKYQNYLETNDFLLGNESFYNCTLPRFGSMCQYELYQHHEGYSSLQEMIHGYYRSFGRLYAMTCYTLMACNRAYYEICLDWTDICDGEIDCLDGTYDEEHCWQLEFNKCQPNEYQCRNGQCILYEFVNDDSWHLDCIDKSDENLPVIKTTDVEPVFGAYDAVCYTEFLTSSCISDRAYFRAERMFSIKDHAVSDECWTAFKCYFGISTSTFSEIDFSTIKHECTPVIKKECPPMLYVPSIPIYLGHIYTAYKTDELTSVQKPIPELPYLCSNKSFFHSFVLNTSFNNTKCFKVANWGKIGIVGGPLLRSRFYIPMNNIFQQIKRFQPFVNFPLDRCNQSNFFQCSNSSKYIPLHRLFDGISDCPYNDDENIDEHTNPQLFAQFKEKYYKCHMSNKYIIQSAVSNKHCDCGYEKDYFCEDEDVYANYTRRTISFRMMCDNFQELYPITIDGRNHTDENECDQWECDNMYTHCDRIWNCFDGKDEMNCNSKSPPLLNCSSNSAMCVTLYTTQLICLSIHKFHDGQIDCLGATDEIMLYRRPYANSDRGFYCVIKDRGDFANIENRQLCTDTIRCENGEDQQFCNKNRSSPIYNSICQPENIALATNVEKFLCDTAEEKSKAGKKYFRINGYYESSENKINENKHVKPITPDNYQRPSLLDNPRCYHGLDVRVWLNKSSDRYTSTCLCPSNFYGNQCQYQNQRISVFMRFYAPAQSRSTSFAILILLIDDTTQRLIHSYEQFTYLSIRDCKIKFNFYLLYSTRPKHPNRTYSIHVDIYEKLSLIYRTSFHYPVKFSFLPVHRLGFVVNVPPEASPSGTCLPHKKCLHGKCFKYFNTKQTFCQCDAGWMGESCDIAYDCTCSTSNSLCIGLSSDNRSICVCRENYFGSRCYLRNRICDNSPCENKGSCFSYDDFVLPSINPKYFCICPKGFSGDRCQLIDTEINLIFDKEISLFHSIFVHFIRIVPYHEYGYEIPPLSPSRSTSLQSISQASNSLRMYHSQPFHLIFIETLQRTYYLAVIQPVYNRSTIIIQRVRSSFRCSSINELVNETFAQLHVLRRMKYYHLICQASPHLECFHDDIHLCLCYDYRQKRLANCFNFNHKMKFDCFGQNHCENHGQCFQESSDCPRRSICACHSCYYGSRCQFSTSEFGLSLDAILAYHIVSDVNLSRQTAIVKISFSLTILFLIVGLINGILSMITFKNKSVLEVGCGVYLLCSSITASLTMILFGLKYFIYLSTQISTPSNRLFLQIQCHSLDFLLRICLNMDQWLNACVSMERAMATIQGVRFEKKKSKQLAKKLIVLFFLFTVSTSIHDPIYRHLFEEENDNDENKKRIWCIVKYSSSLQIYNRVMNTFHFFVPFLINFLSAAILITKKSCQKLRFSNKDKKYQDLLHDQIREHRRLLIAPIVLFLLALPRLILSYVSKCMNSTKDSYVFLGGYFITFIPTMITLLIFVLPSKFYMNEYQKSILRYRKQITQHFRRFN